MKSVTTREIQRNISSLLNELPFSVVVRDKVVAVVIAPLDAKQSELKDALIKELEERIRVLEKPPEKNEWKQLNNCTFPGCKYVGETSHFKGIVFDYELGEKPVDGEFCPYHMKILSSKEAK